MSSAKVRFTASEREACERFVARVEASHPEDSLMLRTNDIRALATIARLVLMLTDAPARARVNAKSKGRKP